jgi:hypothetical protein
LLILEVSADDPILTFVKAECFSISADFGIFIAAETDKWGKVIRAASIKTE